jgi:hypothetical protein
MVDLVKTAAPILAFAVIVACVLGLALGGERLLSSSPLDQGTTGPAVPAPKDQMGIPPIDAAVPARTETATFAFG